MARGRYRLLIFDWDGTLRNSVGSIVECAREAAAEQGLEAAEQAIRGSVGLGLDVAIRLWCPDADEATCLRVRESYGRLWVERWHARADLFPEAEPTLAALHADGYWLAVATGKSRSGLERDLGHGRGRQVRELLLASRTADETTPKPSPAMVHELLEELGVEASEALVIGDSAHDLQMAANAGCAAVGVSCGALPGGELRRLGARAVLGGVGELPAWLARPARACARLVPVAFATMSDLDPTGRFADRVDAYRRARPGYPRALLDHLDVRLSGLDGRCVADLGSGTGMLTALLLDRGCRVWAVEPNESMRRAAEDELGARTGFVSVAGSAEETGLDAGSIDLVTAAQAFHWFDLEATGRELRRVLEPGGRVAVVWNDRRQQGSFLEAYETFLLEWATDYRAVRESYAVADRLGELFAPGSLERAVFANHQDLDFDGLRARLLSSSYMPGSGQPRSDEMQAAVERLFADHESGGLVRIEYDCTLYLGGL